MGASLALLARLLPEVVEQLRRRHALLKATYSLQPLGRRALADQLGWSERVTRAEIDALRATGLIGISADGVSVTQAGTNLLPPLSNIIDQVSELENLEVLIRDRYGLDRVKIVPGDSSRSPVSRHLLSHTAADFITELAQDGDVLAVTGGTTMRDVADNMPTHHVLSNAVIVPARGGLGEVLEIQANTVASVMAGALGAQQRLLHLADEVPDDALNALLAADNTVRSLFELIRSARIVVHGIGAINDVVRRRHLPREVLELLHSRAAGEVLGYYLDEDAGLIHATSSVGLRLEDLRNAEHVIAVAGGSAKARAVRAVLASGLQSALFIDEPLARQLAAAA